MSEGQILSVVALLGWLVLALSGYRAHKMKASETVRMILIWASIFMGVAFVFSLIK